eukprot:scaffold81523_cov64-Attheya_sp.AAC.13
MVRRSREHSCDPQVKELFFASHAKCDGSRCGRAVCGSFLNKLIGDEILKEDTDYFVCARVAARTKGFRGGETSQHCSSTKEEHPFCTCNT